MGMNVGVLFLFVLGASWGAIDARELYTTNFITGETETSDVLVLQINRQEPKRDIRGSEEVGKNDNVCTLCEEFAAEAQNYLAENKTQIEILDSLYKSCSKLLSFKQQCITLVDYYAPLFFFEISSIQPGDFCKKFNLCDAMVFISPHLSRNTCGLCRYAVTEALLKLKDPDTQLEIIELLLKGCDAVESYLKECKRMVFEYGPVIFDNAEEFLETTDICIMLHACGDEQALPIAQKKSMLSQVFKK